LTLDLKNAIEDVLGCLVLENMQRPSFTFRHIEKLRDVWIKETGFGIKVSDLTPGQKVDAIFQWQSDESVHPLTCECGHVEFNKVEVRIDGEILLKCYDCDTEQNYIPEVVYNRYINNNFFVKSKD
jgi:hypothetical protein